MSPHFQYPTRLTGYPDLLTRSNQLRSVKWTNIWCLINMWIIFPRNFPYFFPIKHGVSVPPGYPHGVSVPPRLLSRFPRGRCCAAAERAAAALDPRARRLAGVFSRSIGFGTMETYAYHLGRLMGCMDILYIYIYMKMDIWDIWDIYIYIYIWDIWDIYDMGPHIYIYMGYMGYIYDIYIYICMGYMDIWIYGIYLGKL